VCKKCVKGIDDNSSLLGEHDAQEIVNNARDFAIYFEEFHERIAEHIPEHAGAIQSHNTGLQYVAKKAMDFYGGLS